MARSTKWFNYLVRVKADPAVAGLNPAWWLYHRSFARTNRKNPYLLANEWIAANLGWFLHLPIPPFALMRAHGGTERLFASLDFGSRDVSPDDMQPDILAKALPWLSTGVLLFDILIANPDRHETNLKVDDPTIPTCIEVFDHDRALFGAQASVGEQRLSSLMATTRLGLTAGLNTTHDFHKLLQCLDTPDHIVDWCSRIDAIPDKFITETCEHATDLGASATESQIAVKFLCDRKRRIQEVVKANKQQFKLIKSWPLLLS